MFKMFFKNVHAEKAKLLLELMLTKSIKYEVMNMRNVSISWMMNYVMILIICQS